MTDLGTLGGSETYAFGINAAGRVVGYSSTTNGDSHAYITGADGAGMTDLGTLGGGFSSALGINGAGQVVGFSDTADGARHAFITGANGAGMTDLGTLGGDFSFAKAINDAGQAVGDSFFDGASGTTHPFITGANGVGMTDLNTLVDLPDGVVLTEAGGINNTGQLVATAAVIPEPATYALMLAGLALLGPDGGSEAAGASGRSRARPLAARRSGISGALSA